jgi:carbon-monoxide dehydrogenase large subunit
LGRAYGFYGCGPNGVSRNGEGAVSITVGESGRRVQLKPGESLDRGTGEVKVRRFVAVDDCGNVINPMIVDGQIQGGIAQGLAQAVLETAVYDDNGQLLSGTMMDYAIPKASSFPNYELDRTVTPCPFNPMGLKGVGEAGTIAATPAIMNAIVDALSPLGVEHFDMPASPQRIWQLVHEQKGN